MGRSRQLGMFLVIGATLQALVMLVGTLRRSYLVVALPVLAAVGIISALAFWVGWTMMQADDDLVALEEQEGVPAPA